MIRPIIIAEYHQTRHHFPKALLVVGLLTLLLRLVGGSWGAFIVLIGILPNLGLSMGHGTFAEEFMKGQFKFLFSLPVSRFQIWFVKCISGLIGLAIFSGFVCTIMFAFPSEELRKLFDFLPALEVSPTNLAVLIAGVCLYGFGVGFFSITACTSTRVAGLISSLLLYFPLVAFWVMYQIFASEVPIAAASLVFISAAISFILGALILFGLRNPFVDSAWIRRVTGLSVVLITGAVMTVAGSIALSWPVSYGPPTFDNVMRAHASPDGKHIMVIALRRLIQTNGYIVTADGTIVRDLEIGSTDLGERKLAWRPTSHGFDACFQRSEGLAAELAVTSAPRKEPNLQVLSLESGELSEIPSAQKWESESSVQYIGWAPDGEQLLAVRRTWDRNKSLTQIISQGIESGDITSIGEELENTEPTVLVSGHVVVQAWDDAGEMKTITLLNPRTNTSQLISTSSELRLVSISPDAQSAYFVKTIYGEKTVGHEIVQQSLVDGESSVIVASDELPSASLIESAKGRIGTVYCTMSTGGRWLDCRVYDHRNHDKENGWLIAIPSGDRVTAPEVPDGKVSDGLTFSPSEARILRALRDEYNLGDAEETSDVFSRIKLEVMDIGTAGIRQVCEPFELENAYDFQWLNDDTIIYLSNEIKGDVLNNGNRLWKIELTDCSNTRIVPKVTSTQ